MLATVSNFALSQVTYLIIDKMTNSDHVLQRVHRLFIFPLMKHTENYKESTKMILLALSLLHLWLFLLFYNKSFSHHAVQHTYNLPLFICTTPFSYNYGVSKDTLFTRDLVSSQKMKENKADSQAWHTNTPVEHLKVNEALSIKHQNKTIQHFHTITFTSTSTS